MGKKAPGSVPNMPTQPSGAPGAGARQPGMQNMSATPFTGMPSRPPSAFGGSAAPPAFSTMQNAQQAQQAQQAAARPQGPGGVAGFVQNAQGSMGRAGLPTGVGGDLGHAAGDAGKFGLQTAQDLSKFGTDVGRQTGAIPGTLPGGGNAIRGVGNLGIGGIAPGVSSFFGGGKGGPPPETTGTIPRLSALMRQQQVR